MNNFESISAELSREGQLDSVGVFTVDVLARARKLALMQIKQPSLYILKLLQAAVAAGSSCFTITASVKETLIEFELPANPEPTNFLERLKNDSSSDLQWMRHLLSALQFSLSAESRSLQFAFDDGHAGYWVEVAGQQLTQERGPSYKPGVRLRLESMTTRWWKFWCDPPGVARLKRDLLERAGLANIKIMLNGRDLPVSSPEEMLGVEDPPYGWTETPCGTKWLLEWVGPLAPVQPSGAWNSPLSRFPRLLRVGQSQVNTGDGNLGSKGAMLPCPVGVSRWDRGTAYRGVSSGRSSSVGLDSLRADWLGHSSTPGQLVALEDGDSPKEWLATQRPFLVRLQRSMLSIDPIKSQVVGIKGWDDLGAIRPGPNLYMMQLLDLPEQSSLAFQWAALQRNLPTGPAKLLLLCDGICLDTVEIPQGPPGALAIRALSEVPVDLGHLTPVADSELVQEQMAWALDTWKAQLRELTGIVHDVKTCESMSLAMSIREGWRNWLADQPASGETK